MNQSTRQQQVWFVTGASLGFGRELALEILRRGDRLVAAVRALDSLRELEGRDDVLIVKLDVTKAAEIDTGVQAAVSHFGAIDVLVNSAGFSIVGAVEETGDAASRETMETMFFGPVALTRAVLPAMRERGSGTIVQITSMGGFTTSPGFGAYCAAKHGLEGLSECMAQELAPLGVRVLIVEPGAFRTSLFGERFRSLPPLEAYAATVGKTRAYATDNDGVQPGDPAKAASAIVDAVNASDPPLRLPLGGDAVDGIRAKAARVLADVAASEVTARATAFQTPT